MPVDVVKARDQYRIRVTDRSGLTDWPMQCNDGRILYDHPERHTKTDKAAVERTYSALQGKFSWSFWFLGYDSIFGFTYALMGTSQATWPAPAYQKLAEKLGFSDRDIRTDDTIIGGYYSGTDADLICIPSHMRPWDY